MHFLMEVPIYIRSHSMLILVLLSHVNCKSARSDYEINIISITIYQQLRLEVRRHICQCLCNQQ